jgi:hypothetical protein
MAFKRGARRVSYRLQIEITALVVATLFGLLAPLASWDNAARMAVLRGIGSRQPSPHVLLLSASLSELRDHSCSTYLQGVLARGHARGALLVPPADVFCDARPSPPIVALAPEAVRIGPGNAVLGFDESGSSALSSLGVPVWPWVSPVSAHNVPSVPFADLIQGRVQESVLRGRVVVVSASDAGEAAMSRAAGAEPMGVQVAASIAGLMDGRGRTEASRWTGAVVVAMATALVWTLRRRQTTRAAVLGLIGLAVALALGQIVLAWRLTNGLLAPASLFVGMLIGAAGVFASDIIGWKRALGQTTDMLERAPVSSRLHAVSDESFWPSLGQLASGLHPANFVLIAQLPPGGWYLRFWELDGAGEQLVREKRRDVRREPFCDEQGLPAIRVVKDFLVEKGVPTVIVPLCALGETEGYVFFCGHKAREAFEKTPERTEHIARELALLSRRRRLTQIETDRIRAAGTLRPSAQPSAALVEGVDAAYQDLQLFGEILRSAPTGLLFADSFGNVRLVSRECARWLEGRGIAVPQDSSDAPLPVGVLSLNRVVMAIVEGTEDEAAQSLARMIADEYETARSPIEPGSGRTYELTLRVLHHKSSGFSSIRGYVGTLVAHKEERPSNVRSLQVARATDMLSAFSLSELVQYAAEATRATGHSIRVERLPPGAHIIGHRVALERALKAFLKDIAAIAPSDRPPVVSIHETQQSIELSILDWGTGISPSSLKRVILAPSAPPAGFERFGELIKAIQDSHGEVSIPPADGWGISFVAAFYRSKQRLSLPDTDVPAADAKPASKGSRRKF